jgi:hypothetical protein
LTFSRQINIPIPKIKSSAIVPYYIFASIQLIVKTIFKLSCYNFLLLSIKLQTKQFKYFRA